jgi:hypothetical protein
MLLSIWHAIIIWFTRRPIMGELWGMNLVGKKITFYEKQSFMEFTLSIIICSVSS